MSRPFESSTNEGPAIHELLENVYIKQRDSTFHCPNYITDSNSDLHTVQDFLRFLDSIVTPH